MPTNYSVELTKEQLEMLKNLCPKGSALQRSLQMAVIAAPIPLSVKAFRNACSLADSYSVNRLKEPQQLVERIKSAAERLQREWDDDELLFNTLLANPLYPFALPFDECPFKSWYEITSNRAMLLVFIKQLNEKERHDIEQQLHDIPDEIDLRQAISYACDRLDDKQMHDVPNCWRSIEFKPIGDEEGWI